MHAGKIFILFYLVDLGVCSENIKVIKLYQDMYFDDHISVNQPMKLTISTSILQCTNECILEDSCGSLFYREWAYGMCVMYGSRMSAVNSVMYNPGWKFYHKNQRLCPIMEGYKYHSGLDVCIKPYTNRKTYIEAVQACSIDEAALVKIETQEVWQLVKSVIAPYSSSVFYVQGARDINDVWRYDDNTIISFLPWGTNEPDGDSSDNHLVMWKNDGSLYHDVMGSRQYSYVCEIIMK